MESKKTPNHLFVLMFLLFGFEKAKKSKSSKAPEIKKLII